MSGCPPSLSIYSILFGSGNFTREKSPNPLLRSDLAVGEVVEGDFFIQCRDFHYFPDFVIFSPSNTPGLLNIV